MLGWLVERDGERLYNTAFLLSPDEQVLGKYRKVQANFGEQTSSGAGLAGGALSSPDVGEPSAGRAHPLPLWRQASAPTSFPETVRCNELLGAKLVIHQSIADDMGHLVPARAFERAASPS